MSGPIGSLFCCQNDKDDVCCSGDSPGCPTTFCGATKIGTALLTTPTAYFETMDFGTQPAGLYFGAYCDGMASFQRSGEPTLNDTVHCTGAEYLSTPPLLWGLLDSSQVCPAIVWEFQDPCNCNNYTYAPCYTTAAPSSPPPCTNIISTAQLGNSFATEADALAAYAGSWLQFVHSGGDIALQYSDCPVGDNTAGTSIASWALYYLPMPNRKISLITSCASWTSVGSAATVTFTIRNRNCVNWCNVSVSLASSGGITSPSGTQTGITLDALTNNDFSFTFNVSNVGVTATLTLSCPGWPSNVVLTVFLAPIISVALTNPVVICPGSGISNQGGYFLDFVFTNTGNWTVNPTTVTISFDSSLLVVFGSHPCNSSIWDAWPQTISLSSHVALQCNNAGGSDSINNFGVIIVSHGFAVCTLSSLTEGSQDYTSFAVVNGVNV